MPGKDAKLEALRQQGTLNPRPDEVTDERFAAHSFFDPRDLVQVKYEMLRRVQADGKSITDAEAAFGFSRPSFYQAQSARTRRAGRSGAAQTRPQAGAQAHRRSPRFRPRDASEHPGYGSRRTGATDSSALWHYRASAKYPARVTAPSKKTSLSRPNDQPVARPDLVVIENSKSLGMVAPGYRDGNR
jgi:hypothetical protein